MPSLGSVLSVFRFPVKSMGGERVPAAAFDHFGMVGDRAVAVVAVDDNGTVVETLTARRSAWLLMWSAGFDGVAIPDAPTDPTLVSPDGTELPAGDPRVVAMLEVVAGRPLLLRSDPQRHADFPGFVHLTFESTRVALQKELRMDLDIRRFRPNLHLAAGVVAFSERDWIGRILRFQGGLTLEVVTATERCVIPAADPSTGARARGLLRHLGREHDLAFGLYARVRHPAMIKTGAGFTLDEQFSQRTPGGR